MKYYLLINPTWIFQLQSFKHNFNVLLFSETTISFLIFYFSTPSIDFLKYLGECRILSQVIIRRKFETPRNFNSVRILIVSSKNLKFVVIFKFYNFIFVFYFRFYLTRQYSQVSVDPALISQWISNNEAVGKKKRKSTHCWRSLFFRRNYSGSKDSHR